MLSYLKTATNVAYTENGAKAYGTTGSALVNLFAQGGALRTRSDIDKISMFTKAFAEDELLAMKMLFYFRDVRGGQGERQTFRTTLKYLADNHTEVIKKNLHLIPYYGRWDDMYELVGTKLEKSAFGYMAATFMNDMMTETPSLLGKWLKSENATSTETKRLATKTRKAFRLEPVDYRKALTSLRQKIAIVEAKMSAKQWGKINYEHVPSQAAMRYRSAFARNDANRYQTYLDSLNKGEAKINTKAMFPYEIVEKALHFENNPTLNAMWDNLPDYIGDKQENSIAVVDTSGSMSGLPMAVAISIGMYLAERNNGLYKDHFITFSNNPQLQQITGKTLYEKVTHMRRADWNMTTNVESVFKLILHTAVQNHLPQSEMIQKVYIISDMEFNSADGRADEYLFKKLARDYEQYNYKLPKLVFWNVDARNAQFPMTMNDSGVQLVSGCSPSIFTSLMKGEFVSPYDLMLDVLNNERYSAVSV